VLFGLLNMPWTGLQLGEAKMLPFDLHTGGAQFEMSLIMVEFNSGIQSYIEYHTGLFEAATIARVVGHYSLLLRGMTSNPHAPIHSLEILSAEERRMLLEDFNATTAFIPETTVVRLLEEQGSRTPKATAVQYGEDSLSYMELNHRTNQLARRLQELGVGLETRVGLMVERSLEMVVGLLGVLKAGAAYVPLDPDYPPERLSYMLDSAQVKVLLTHERLRGQTPPFPGPVLDLDGAEEQRRIAEQKTENLDVAILPEHLAYIIYTSGSTGRPKGVMNSHGGLLNRLLWMQEEYRLEPRDVVLQKTPFSFDVSVWEFLWPLLAGAKLVVARPGGHQDPSYLATLIQDQQITTLHFVPSMLAVFVDEERSKQCKSIRRVVCSGEALPPELARRCLASMPWTELHNLYGPTEAAIDVTYWKCLAEDTRASVPIGKAIANIRVYAVDEGMNPVPVGVPGELCLGGVGLARGYWGRGDLTAERFVPDGLSGRMGERLYRTGDLVRWLADGNLEYLGRLDHQVKIRGFRIELGEIETALMGHPKVQEAVVLAREDEAGDRRLVAYVVAGRESGESKNGSGSRTLGSSELREHLLGRLPEYMVPSAYVQLEKLPLNHNGKIDRKSLPEPERDTTEREFVGPRNATEETLCRLWQEVLRQERVGVHDHFFKVGGHSLLAAQLATRLRGSFKVDIPLRRMFEAPTIAQLAVVIDQAVQTAGVNGSQSHLRPAIKRVARKAALVDVD
jgi:amino acid adenylation domain-containing protein